MDKIENRKSVKVSLREYSRGIAGGLLFSFPLIYTMEVWWAGFIASPFSLLVLVLVTFFLLLGYNRYAGMHPDSSWSEVATDSIEEMGIGLIISTGVLLMINRISMGSMGIDEIMGKIVIEATFVSVGVSIGTAQLGVEQSGGKKNKGDESSSSSGKDKFEYRTSKSAVAVLALCGSLVVGGNVAPTEEILMIAAEAQPVHILTMAIVSLLLSVGIVFFSEFKGSVIEKPDNWTYHLVFDTVMCYCIALASSAFVLWFFDRFENASLWLVSAEVITLGVLSSLGASAGRLLIK